MKNTFKAVRSRIGIATDEPISGRGILSILQEDGEYRVVWLPVATAGLLQSAALLDLDALLIDMACDVPSDIVERLRNASCAIPLILWQRLAAGASPELAQGTVTLDKRSGPEMVVACLRSLLAGKEWAPLPEAANQIVSEPPPSTVELTAREVQLMRLVSEGLSNKQIGERLTLTEGSVKVYFSRLFRKLGVRDRVGLAVYSLQHVWERPGVRVPRAE